jgi:hypothetical protein
VFCVPSIYSPALEPAQMPNQRWRNQEGRKKKKKKKRL